MKKITKIIIGILITLLVLFGLIRILLPLTMYIYNQNAISNAYKKSTISEQENNAETSENSTVTDSQDDFLGFMTDQETESFNSSFTPYEGSHSGVQTAGLVKKVLISNQTYSDDLDRQISIEFMGKLYSGDDISNISSLIKNSDTYNITLKYSSDNFVETISINQ